MHYKTLKALLKKNGSSLTKPRKTVFDLLLNQKPQSMQVLASRAKGRVDRATVYRTIDLFERLGIVPGEIDSGHCPALSRPRELAERLDAYRTGLQASASDH